MDSTEALVKAVRRLTIAVWCVFSLQLAWLGWGISSYVRAILYTRDLQKSVTTSQTVEKPPIEYVDEDNDFAQRPVRDRIRRATVILLAERKDQGGMHKAIISEILKQSPGVRFYYKVGDEYEELGHFPRQNCAGCEGEGDVVFLTGNPATMRESLSYQSDRIAGLGDMTIAELRRLAQESLTSPAGR